MWDVGVDALCEVIRPFREGICPLGKNLSFRTKRSAGEKSPKKTALSSGDFSVVPPSKRQHGALDRDEEKPVLALKMNIANIQDKCVLVALVCCG